MRKSLLFFVICFIPALVEMKGQAPVATTDTIQVLLHLKPEDSVKVNRLNAASKRLGANGDYHNAILCAEEAGRISTGLEVNGKKGWTSGMVTAEIYQGYVYHRQGNYPEALRHYLEGLRLSEKDGFQWGMALSQNCIGSIYMSEMEYEKATGYFRQALAIRKKIGDLSGYGSTLMNLGIMYKDKGAFDSALVLYREVLEIRYKLKERPGMAACFGNIANIYMKQNLLDSALDYSKKSAAIRREIGDKKGETNSLLSMADIYFLKGDYKQAQEYFDRVISISQGLKGNFDVLRNCFHDYSRLDSVLHLPKQEFLHYRSYIAYRDSLNNETNTKKMVATQMQYEFDKKSAADSIHTAEKKKQDDLKHNQEIKQQKLYTYGGVGGFALMLIVAIVSIRAFRNKQKANEIISHQKAIVEEKQKEILDSIHYAQRIQKSLLPTEKYIDRYLNRKK